MKAGITSTELCKDWETYQAVICQRDSTHVSNRLILLFLMISYRKCMINLMDLSEMQQRNESGKYQKIAVEGMSVESQILGLDKICLRVIS